MKKKIKIISSFAQTHKWKFFSLLFCVIITAFSGSIYPYIFGKLVDEVFYSKNMNQFAFIVLLYGIAFLFNQVIHFVLNIIWANLMTRFLFEIRKKIFKTVLTKKGGFLAGMHSGDIISRMKEDTEKFMDFIYWNVFIIIGDILELLFTIVIIIKINVFIALLTVILTPVFVFISRQFAKKIKPIYQTISENRGLLSSWLFEIIKGMQDIKLLCAAKSILSDYVGKTIKIFRLQIKANKIELVADRINAGISLLGQITLYAISVILIFNGYLTIGGFIACVSYFGRCFALFSALSNKSGSISNNVVGIDRVISILEGDQENYYSDKAEQPIRIGNIEFSDVVFSYNDDVKLFNGVSFKINSGERVALVGHSGAGKSTIANLILKFYEIQKGNIFIDDIDIAECNLHSLRKQIGIVHQETILFEGSIRYNLVFSDDKVNDEKIFIALKKAHLYDFVLSLTEGLDTIIGTEGRALSGGQKQRLAVARIFLKNPKILIFDEATSSLDNEAGQVIKESWDMLCEGRTTIIIAHRLSTIINADKLLVLHDGVVTGYDTHANLLKTCDTYVQLFKEQYSLQEGATINA